VKGIQLREKDLGGRELFDLAEKVKALCVDRQASLFINDRVDVALAVDADGIHLGGASLPIEAARALVGTDKLIGVSTHSMREAEEAERGGGGFSFIWSYLFYALQGRLWRVAGSCTLKGSGAKNIYSCLCYRGN